MIMKNNNEMKNEIINNEIIIMKMIIMKIMNKIIIMIIMK